MTSKLRLAAACAVVAATATTAPSLAAQPTASSSLALASAVPHWATHAALRGVVPAGRQVSFDILLRYRNAAALAAFDRAVADPASSTYGHYLTTHEFTQRFSPTASEVSRVTSWLWSAGLQVDGVSPSRILVQAHGTAAKVEAALGTVLARFSYRGKVLQAPEVQPTVPARLLPDVAAVVGLADSEALI